MSKKITVTLSDKSEEFFNELMYSLEGENGGTCTKSEVINWCLEAMKDFEDNAGEDLISYLRSNYSVYTDTKPKNK